MLASQDNCNVYSQCSRTVSKSVYICKMSIIPMCCVSECDRTFYGEQCNIPCSDFCQSRICNQTFGQCISCVGSRTGSFCENESKITANMSA